MCLRSTKFDDDDDVESVPANHGLCAQVMVDDNDNDEHDNYDDDFDDDDYDSADGDDDDHDDDGDDDADDDDDAVPANHGLFAQVMVDSHNNERGNRILNHCSVPHLLPREIFP